MKDKYTDVQLRIIDAARKLFTEKGYEKATIREIASEAKVNAAMINYHFRSKEDLFYIIFEEVHSTHKEKVLSLLDSDLPFFKLIREWVYLYFDLYLNHPDYHFILNSKLSKDTQKRFINKPEHKSSPLIKKLSKLLKKEEAKGTIHPVSVDYFYLFFLSLVAYPMEERDTAIQRLNLSEKKYMEFLNNYKEYVVDVIIRAIKKKDNK
jgi:AcrR family transcriptional regulator